MHVPAHSDETSALQPLTRRVALRTLGIASLGLLAAACAPGAPAAPTAAPASQAKPASAAPTTAPAAGATTAPTVAAAPAAAGAPAAGCGGTVTEGTNGDGSIVNPILLVDSDGYFRTDQMFDAMVVLDPETLKPQPRLAKSWDVSADGLTYTFHLQQAVTWHDGQPFSAEDVRFTVMSMLAPDYAGPFQSRWKTLVGGADVAAGKAQDLEGLKVLDPNTIQFKLLEPNATFLTLVMPDLKPIPMHILQGQKITPDHPFSLKPVGTGAYKFSEWVKGDHFTMTANSSYWGGAPCIDRIQQRVIPDMNALVLGIQAGDFDFTIVPPPSEVARLKSDGKLNVITAPPFALEAIQFNMLHPQLKDRRVREAISRAFDREKFAKENMAGVSNVAPAPVVSGSWASDPSIQTPSFDMAKAKQLLADAGYPNGGFSVSISANAGNTYREEGSTILQANLKQLGIDAKVDLGEWGKFIGGVRDKKFDIAFFSYSAGFPDPDKLSASFQTNGSDNYYSYSNPQVDDLLTQARKINDFDKRKDLYVQVQKILMDDLPLMPIVNYPHLIAINKKFQGLVPSSRGMRWNIRDWKVG